MTDLSRLDMPDGAWATFRTRYGWTPSIRIQAAIIDGASSERFFTELVRQTLTAWHVPTEAGGWLDWAASDTEAIVPDSQLATIDSRWGDLVLDRCSAIWAAWQKGRPDPKGTAAPSPSGQPESA